MNTPPTPEQEMQQRYRNVFGSAEGMLVLGDILTMGHFGEPLTDLEHVARNNFAVSIARLAGVLDSLYIQLGMAQERYTNPT